MRMRGTRDASRQQDQPSETTATLARGGQDGTLLREARAGRPAALLALQRQVGNGAVAALVHTRLTRALCRCPGRCTCGGEEDLGETEGQRVLARTPTPAANGQTFTDDPLSDAGFGPDDATLRMRPGPVRTTLITSQPDLSCAYQARLIARWGGPAGPMPTDRVCRDIVTALTGCDIAYVTIDVVPKATGDDPTSDAIDRAETIKKALIQWIGPKRFSEDRFSTGLSSGSTDGAEVEVWLAGENRGQHGSSSGPAPMGPPEAPPPAASKALDDIEHLGVQGGVGDVRHHYTTPYGPNDALHEWVNQVVAAYTMQRHRNNESGEERQIFAQVQYSLTTKQFTVSFGGQESYVIALPANLQLSFWAQLTAGQNVSGGTSQESLSAGTQLVWQPNDWLSFGVQGGAGPTVQSQGPSSVDRTGLLFFQIQK
jgi:hypothetical protein